MTIEKRGNSYRIRQMYKGKTYSVTVDHKPTQKEATILLAEAMQESADSSAKGSFEANAKKYISNRENVISVTTAGGYNVLIRNMPRWWLDTNLYDIDADCFQRAVDEYASNHSPKSVANMASFCRSVITTYRPNFHVNITLPKRYEPKKHVPTAKDVAAVITAVKGTEYEIPFRLACYGLRKGEICALELSDLDGNVLSIRKSKARKDGGGQVIKGTKTETSVRNIYIDDGLAELIRKQGYIYRGYPDSLLRHLHNVQSNLKIEPFRFHDIRHYFVTELSDANVPEADIMYLGGYSSPGIMKRIYRHPRTETDLKKNKKNLNIIAKKIGVQ